MFLVISFFFDDSVKTLEQSRGCSKAKKKSKRFLFFAFGKKRTKFLFLLFGLLKANKNQHARLLPSKKSRHKRAGLGLVLSLSLSPVFENVEVVVVGLEMAPLKPKTIAMFDVDGTLTVPRKTANEATLDLYQIFEKHVRGRHRRRVRITGRFANS